MCKELKRTFRPDQRDVEVLYQDDFGIEKWLYVGLALGPVDVNAKILEHFAQEEATCKAVRGAALKAMGKEF